MIGCLETMKQQPHKVESGLILARILQGMHPTIAKLDFKYVPSSLLTFFIVILESDVGYEALVERFLTFNAHTLQMRFTKELNIAKAKNLINTANKLDLNTIYTACLYSQYYKDTLLKVREQDRKARESLE